MGKEGHGGRRPGAGRRKGVINQSTKELRDFLNDNKNKLIQHAIKRAKVSDTVLNKLLDKLLPNLNNNQNTDESLIAFLRQKYGDQEIQKQTIIKSDKDGRVQQQPS